MMFYTGLQRTAHEVVQSQLERTSAGKITPPLNQLGDLVDQGIELLGSSMPLEYFGRLLHDGWMLKRQFSDTRCSRSSLFET